MQDVLKLSTLAGKINTATGYALDAFRRLLKLQSNPSPDLLRSYASFLIDVAADEVQGKILLKRADESEELRMAQKTCANCLFLFQSECKRGILFLNSKSNY